MSQNAPPIIRHPPVVTIQRTGKPIKFFLALFSLGLLASIALFIFGDSDGLKALGMVAAAFCTVGFLAARIARWWSHG